MNINCIIVCWLLASFASLALSNNLKKSKKLVYVSTVYRHGDRAPMYLYPNSPEGPSVWPQGYGQLTQRGMRQEAILGKFFKKRYTEKFRLINKTYIRNEVRIRSTNVDRTLMSAESQLSSLYPPFGRQIWNKNLHWQPIPIHTVPRKEDTLLLGYDLPCKRYSDLKKEYRMSSEYRNFSKKYENFLKNVSKLAGYTKPLSLGDSWKLYDALFCEQQHNFTLPKWATDETIETLHRISDFGMMALFHGKPAQKIVSGELIYRIINDMKMVRSNKKTMPTKMMMYSSHDTTVLAFLCALSVANGVQPPYTAAAIVELYVDTKNDYFVQILYRNSTNPPYVLTIPGCTVQCPLDKFIKLTSPVTTPPGNFSALCNDKIVITRVVGHFPFATAIVIAVGGLILGMLISYAACSNRKNLLTRRPSKGENLLSEYEYNSMKPL